MERKKYKITFGQIYLSKPMMTESDGETTTLFPHEARLRNLTCVPGSAAAAPGLEAARARINPNRAHARAALASYAPSRRGTLELTALRCRLAATPPRCTWI